MYRSQHNILHVSLYGFKAQNNESYALTYDMQTKHDVHKVSIMYIIEFWVEFRGQYAQNEHAMLQLEKHDMTNIPALMPVIIVLY